MMCAVTKIISNRFVYVWSGEDFPYVNVLSVLLVRRHHPQSEICVYVVGKRPVTYWFGLLERIPEVRVHFISGEDVLQELPAELSGVRNTYEKLSPNAYSARSNILRYALLYLHGGIYLDFDVLVIRPFIELAELEVFAGREMVWADDEARLRGRQSIFLAPRNILWAVSHALMWLDAHLFRGHLRIAALLSPTFGMWSRLQMNNAVIGAAPHSDFVEQLLVNAVDAEVGIRYATGPTLIEFVSNMRAARFESLPPSSFYSVPPGQSYRLFYDETFELPEDAFAIHYAASNHAHFVKSALPSSIEAYSRSTAMGALLREAQHLLDELIEDVKTGLMNV